MREIKFRAWDKEKKEMLYDIGSFQNRNIWFLATQECAEEFDVMQYTGLKDNKRTKEYPEGQEIYEGDIYKWEDDEIGYIEWDEHTSGFCRRRKQNPCVPYALHSDTVQDIEVIGNIPENPKLLEKQDA